jgi:hypothetical protein
MSRRAAAGGRSVSDGPVVECQEGGRTAVGDLAGVATGARGTPLGESGPDLAQALSRGARPDALVTRNRDLLSIALLVLDGGGNLDNLVGEEALLLRALRTLEALGSVCVHLLAGDAKVARDVLRRPAHGHHALLGLLRAARDALVEGLVEGIAAGGHGLGTDGDSNGDGALGDGVGNIGCSLETGGAEAIDGRCRGGIGEAGGEGGGAQLVGGLAVGHVAEADVLNEGGVDVGAQADLLEEGEDEVLEGGVLEAALLGLCQRGADGKCDYDIVGVLGLAGGEEGQREMDRGKRVDGTCIWFSADPGLRCLTSEVMRS